MKYFNLAGLTYLWNKLKNKIPTKVSDLTNDSKFVSSDNITSILVVDELPAIEEEGVLYLVRETGEEYVEYPQMEMGDISRTGVLSDSIEYTRTSDYIYVGNCSSVTITTNAGSDIRTRVLCYDSNKNFIENWYEDSETYYSYANLPNPGILIPPTSAKYIKCRFGATSVGVIQMTYNFD